MDCINGTPIILSFYVCVLSAQIILTISLSGGSFLDPRVTWKCCIDFKMLCRLDQFLLILISSLLHLWSESLLCKF